MKKLLVVFICVTVKLFSQTYSSTGNTGNNSWSVYQTNSPTNIYGNRYNCLNINRDSIVMRTKYVMLDSMYQVNSSMITGGKLAWLSGRRMMLSKYDSLPLSSRQITLGLGYVPSVSGSSVSSFNNRTGSITLLNTDVNTALGYTPLQTEVDGSITNEIQTLSLSGQTISLSGANSITLPSLTSPQVTTALGYIPLQIEVDGSVSNEIQTLSISGYSLSLSAANTVIVPSITPSTGISLTSGSVVTNTLPDQTVVITSDNSNVAVTSSYPNFTLSPYVPSTFTVSRAINSSTFQTSSTKNALVFYSIRINCTATIGSSSSGTITLQYSTNNGSTWIDVGQIENSPSVALAAILSLNDNKVMQISGAIPAGAIIRINQASSGTVSFTFIKGSETY